MTAHYKETLNRHVQLFLTDVYQDDNGPDLEFGMLRGRAFLEMDTQFALNRVTRCFVLSMGNVEDDDERLVLTTRGSPVAALKYVGSLVPGKGVFNADSGEYEEANDEVMAIVKRFRYLADQAMEKLPE